MNEIFSVGFERSIAKDDHARPIQRAFLRLTEAMAHRQRSYDNPLEFVRTPCDPMILAESHQSAERLWTSRLRYVLLIGIGGSNLGAKAVYEALIGLAPRDRHARKVELLCLDTCETMQIERVIGILEENVEIPEEIVVIVATKSGTTAETLVNADVVLGRLIARSEDFRKRVLVVSDPAAPTRKFAEANGYLFAPIPKSVGGRFSVFTPMGLIPLRLLGIDIEAFRDGANEMVERILDGKDTSAVRLAKEIGSMRQQGYAIMDLFFFVPALESLGKWARQLVAESIGKEFDRDGRTIHNGITPTVSIGSVDLHSVAQLNFGGPKDKWTMLVSARSHELKEKASGWSKLADIPEVSPGEVFDAILAGTRAAYAKRDLPLLHVELSSVSPYTIGAWMAWFMIATYISSEIMNLNAFDQPAVEDYKRATREHLSHHKQ